MKNNSMASKTITTALLKSIRTDIYRDEEWKPLVEFFWKRYDQRYFQPIIALQKHTKFEIRNNCGFIITTIDCVLIETLEQYYAGKDETKGHTHDAFLSFFKRSKIFGEVIKDSKEAGVFAGLIRSGLLHQSKTKKSSTINKKNSTPILEWVDSNNKSSGFILNRDKFHKAVHDQFKALIEEIKKPENHLLRGHFKSKLESILT
jgi:hypothetical protein